METNKETNSTTVDSEDVELNWNDDSSRGKLSDGVKKWMSAGISTFMLSEEALRSYFQDKVPKEVLGQFLKGMSKSKEEIVHRVGDEMGKIIQKIDVVEEFTRFLREHTIKCSFEMEFKKRDLKDVSAKSTKES